VFKFVFAKGNGFTNQNTTINKKNDAIPVVLGYNYINSFQLGEEFDLELHGIGYATAESSEDFMKVKVVGFLEKGAKMPEWGGDEWIELDNYIVCATGCHFDSVPDSQQVASMYLHNQLTDNMEYGFIAMKDGASYNNAIHEINENVKKFDVFSLIFTSTSFGSKVLQNETNTTILVLEILAIIMFVFMTFCLITNAISKFQRNSQTYAIYIVNGCSISTIIIPYILEMIVIAIPGVLINRYILEKPLLLSGNKIPFYTVIGMAIVVVFVVAAVIVTKLKTLNIEEYMRRE